MIVNRNVNTVVAGPITSKFKFYSLFSENTVFHIYNELFSSDASRNESSQGMIEQFKTRLDALDKYKAKQ